MLRSGTAGCWDRRDRHRRSRSTMSVRSISCWRRGTRRSHARSIPEASGHTATSRSSCARRSPRSIPSWRGVIRRLPARRWLTVALAVCALSTFAVPHATRAQTTDELTPESLGLTVCSKPTVEWSRNPVIRDLRTQYRDLSFELCRVREDYNDGGLRGMLERQFGTVQDVIVDVFTGRGLHPTAGTIVPQSGTALGLALNNEWHITEDPHSRFT